MRRTFLGGLLTASVILGFSSGASAIDVQRSGNTYHAAVCPHAVGMAANCDARIVTDRLGHPLTGQLPPINGKTPADLTSAYKITTATRTPKPISVFIARSSDCRRAPPPTAVSRS